MDQNAWTDFWSQSYIEFQNRKKKKEMSSVTLNFVIFVILTMCSFVKKGQISHESQPFYWSTSSDDFKAKWKHVKY